MTKPDEPFYPWADSALDEIFIGTHGYFCYLNPAAVQLFGATSAARLLGKRIVDCIHPEEDKEGWNADRDLERSVAVRTQELKEKERFLQEILNAIPIPLFFKDLEGRYLGCNSAFSAATGKTAAEIRGKTVFELWPSELAKIYHQKDLELMDTPTPQHYESEIVDKFSQVRQVLYAKNVFSNDRGEVAGIIGAFIDITERKRAEAELAERSAELTRANAELSLAASVFHESVEGVLVTDAESTILSVNPAFTEITGYTGAEAIGRKPRLLRSDRHDLEFYRSMWDRLIKDGRWQGEIWNRRKSGEAYLEWLTINRITDASGRPIRYVAVFHDITEMRSKDERIRHLAFHDALTGLPNRSLLHDRLEHALARAKREGRRLSVSFIDLDRFKAVNDGLGHDVGDLLLQEVAHRIQLRLRSMDTVARMGGDEFVVLMEDFDTAGDCATLADELIRGIAQPMALRGHTVEVGASMGIAFFPEDGSEALELMKRADMAMYAAKAAGRSTYRFFQKEMLEHVNRHLSLEMELRRAVARQEFELHYQPRVDLATGRALSVEALLRWRHPDRGLLLPSEFIALAEESGLIVDIGAWVLDEACRQVSDWLARGTTLRVAVNVSAKQMGHGDLVERIRTLTVRHAISPALLEIELTESAVMADPEEVAIVFSHLRKMGITIAFDDFGTGYSSLAYLRRLPIDVLKIDRSFVMNVDRAEEDAQIVKTILALGHSLKLSVVAEGIETSPQAELLKSVGCNIVQGYHFSRPLPPAQLDEWLQRHAVTDIDTRQG